ncbi:MAG TPA: dephospho-CoA kinase [Longimicrobiales bacterium]
MAKLFRVGLTGNIASGKSSVVAAWRDLGAHVIDADVLARAAIAPGTPGHGRVLDEFGTVDRARLRELVFRDPARREALERIIHPEVARLRAEQEAQLAQAGVPVVVNDSPLLFEAGLEGDVDLIVLVDAPRAERIRRIVDNRGIAADEAELMVNAQMPAEQKRRRSDIVIENDGSMADLKKRADEAWRQIQQRASA